MTAPAATTGRVLRSDAERNRVRLLIAAAEVFAEQGLDASVEDIARRAGVGIGTLYRRFPTKEALLAELAEGLVDRVVEIADEALAEPDPGAGFEAYLRGIAGLASGYGRGLGWLWAGPAPSTRLRKEINPRVRRLIAGAQDAGRLRRDFGETDVSMVMWSVNGVVDATWQVAPGLWQRHLEVLLDGLRPPVDGHTFTHPPVTTAQADRARALRGRQST